MQTPELREGLLMLEDGTLFKGLCHSPGTAFGEVVFNTSMTGYQEILTDPSYRRQIVVMTQPHIGNYGTGDRMAESDRPWAEGFIARRFTEQASNHGSEADMPGYLRRHKVPALSAIDTRALVRRLRDHGAMRGVITDQTSDQELERLKEELMSQPTMVGRALVQEVTRRNAEVLEPLDSGTLGWTPHIGMLDFGAKGSIAEQLRLRGARVTLLPADTSAEACLEGDYDGFMLSNGPGDPEPLGSIIETVRALVESNKPMFGICLGHQLLALALGGVTYKLKFGHHGGNQPVQDLETGQVTITSQNHGFAVDPESLPDHVRITHLNLNDQTVEGLAINGRPVFSVQYHPEAAPGPHDAYYLFDRFLDSIPSR